MIALSICAAFSPACNCFCIWVASLLQRSQVSQHKFSIYDFDVADGINGRADVMNVRIFKTAHHLHDRLHFANVVEELITETFPRFRAFDESSDVHKLVSDFFE